MFDRARRFYSCIMMNVIIKHNLWNIVVVFDISELRPNGATVNNSAKFSGAAFMDLGVTNTIAQNGRRH